jgi:hypothetical protein
MRTQSIQLPSYEELCNIVSFEANRKVLSKKENIHYTNLSCIIELLREFKLPTTFFDSSFKFIDFQNPRLFHEVTSIFSDLVDNILEAQNDTNKKILFNKLYDYLSEDDMKQKVDIIFVFGSQTTFRTQKAINLYKDGYAPKILISGKCPFYKNSKDIIPEAKKLAEFAMENGIPENDLILEQESITLPDNIKRSLNILESKNIPHDSLILVNSPFSQRRGWAHFNKFSKDDNKLIRCNVDTISHKYSKDGWYKNEDGANTIVKEFIALKMGEILNSL